MKNKIFKKIKLITAFILTGLILITNLNVNAVDKSVAVGDKTYISPLIGNVSFHIKVTKSGQYVYCIDRWKDTVANTTGTLIGEKDAGFAYIIANGYPNKSFTGDRTKDYYITQSAVWWYIDDINGNNNAINKEFKTTATDKYNLRPYIKSLVEGAKKARAAGYEKTSISLNASNTDMSLSTDGKYFVSKDIAITSTNVDKYTVKLSNAPTGTIIVDENGNNKTTFKSNEKFKVKVLAKNVTKTSLNIEVSVSATGTVNKVYEYKPTNTKMQNFITTVLVPETTEVSNKINLSISSSKVTIVKLDKSTEKPLAGAELVVKDSKGVEKARWTSTTNAHIILNLENGKYTVEEINAPKGYKKLSEPISFVVSESNKNITVKVSNEARESVVTITKIDKSTEKPLAGATLVIKKQDGTEVKRFTTTEEAYSILNLENGTYILEEISAPQGYKKSDDQITFTIDDNNLTHQITFENYPEVVVPNTASDNSLLTTIIGIIIISSAVGFIYKNAKKTK